MLLMVVKSKLIILTIFKSEKRVRSYEAIKPIFIRESAFLLGTHLLIFELFVVCYWKIIKFLGAHWFAKTRGNTDPRWDIWKYCGTGTCLKKMQSVVITILKRYWGTQYCHFWWFSLIVIELLKCILLLKNSFWKLYSNCFNFF